MNSSANPVRSSAADRSPEDGWPGEWRSRRRGSGSTDRPAGPRAWESGRTLTGAPSGTRWARDSHGRRPKPWRTPISRRSPQVIDSPKPVHTGAGLPGGLRTRFRLPRAHCVRRRARAVPSQRLPAVAGGSLRSLGTANSTSPRGRESSQRGLHRRAAPSGDGRSLTVKRSRNGPAGRTRRGWRADPTGE